MERENGNYATIRYDKLIIRSNKVGAPGNKKRNLPTSTGEKDPTGTTQVTQVNKKNKIQTKQGLHRPSNSSEGVLKPGILNYLTNKNPGNPSSEQINKNTKQ